jgi:hypothetical protein
MNLESAWDVTKEVGGDVLDVGADAHSLTELAEASKGPHEIAEAAERASKSFEGFEGMGFDASSRIEDLAHGAAPTFAETVEQAQYSVASADTMGGALGKAGEWLSPFALAAGIKDGRHAVGDMEEHGANLQNGQEIVKAGLDTTAGGIGTVGLVGSMLTRFGGTELAQSLGLGASAEAGGLGSTGVAAEAGAGASAGAGALAEFGAVAGAGAGGMAMGDWMGKTADGDATRTGLWGKDDSGKNKSAMDWGAGWGTWVDTHTGDKNAAHPSVLGGIASMVGGIDAGFAGTAQAHPLMAELMMAL